MKKSATNFMFLFLFGLMMISSCAGKDIVEITFSPDIDTVSADLFSSSLASVDNSLIIKRERGVTVESGKSIKIILQLEGKGDYADFFVPVSSDQRSNTPLKTVLGKKIFAPYTFFYNPALSVSSEEIRNGKYKIKLFDEITLPEKALAAGGLYPDNNSYPLEAEITALFPQYGEDSKKDKKIESLAAALVSYYKPLPASSNNLTWISFTGDIMPLRGVERLLADRENRLEKVFGSTLEILQKSSLAIGNLETAVTDLGSASKLDKSYNFKAPYQVLPRLKEAGFGYLMITNNHSFDYGIEGFKDTLLNLEKAGIATSGAGLNRDEAIAPWSKNINGTKINIFSLSDYPPEKLFSGRSETEAKENRPGTAWYSEDFLSYLKLNSDKNTIDIVCIHGGFEWTSSPASSQKNHFRKLTENGADIVVGSHPHVLQPLEISGSSLIAYSTGNFIFPGMEETRFGEETIILETGWHGSEMKYINIHPVKITGTVIDIDTSGKIAERFLKMNREWNSNKQ
ncbi:MAG: CapA family protein [Spirochaetia bacterium]|jgi:poly-gamma-glutamate synthesis protein (capsule biosynthesis protein)|nr:CapA family protein [Spirochaetia bacterium]